MSRATPLSIDNVLRFLQLRTEGTTLSEIQRGFKLRKSEQRALVKIVANLKKRKAIVELTDGRLVLPNRRQDREKTPGQPEKRPGPHPAPRQAMPLVGRNSLSGRLILHQDGYG